MEEDVILNSNNSGTEELQGLVPGGSSSGASTTSIKVTVPVIKGKIPKAIADKLIEQGYKKVRAVVVYPEMQDRQVVCQGVTCPTLYTNNHRGDSLADNKTRDLYAQSSWFFRPYYENTNGGIDSNYSESTNIPYSENGKTIGYMDNAIGDASTPGYDPKYIKKTEIQGHFYKANKFRVDWKTLTFHSPDVEFDTQMQNLDYSSSALGYKYVGNVGFIRTLSDIDIQTETPTISDEGAGFVKKSFVRNGAAGIISGLFWDDLIVDDTGSENKLEMFRSFVYQKNPAKWMVYLWNRNGSLNNDITRPADYGVASAVLKKKIISNLRFSGNITWEDTIIENKVFKTHLFASDQNEILKLDTGDNNASNIYRGNIDTLVTSDESDGMYFAFNINNPVVDYDKEIYRYYGNAEFESKINWKTFEDENARHGNWRWDTNKWHRFDEDDGNSLYKFEEPVGDFYKDLVLKKNSVRIKYKSTPHLVIVQQKGTDNNPMQPDDGNLPIMELTRQVDSNTIFGGKSQDALKENVWIPCGEPVRLDALETETGTNKQYVNFEYSWGDTYYQRWDCLKTYAFTPEDINQVVEIGSFMLETHVNIDGRYDRNRGQLSNLYMSPQNFNLINPVYSQLNNFFTYRIQDSDAYNDKYFPNLITWSKTKTSGADVDLWTNVTLASTLEMDGDKGKVRKLARLNDQLFCFQDKGISQVLYNDNVQISSTDGVPIEIANSGKVMGKKYFSDSIGCSNKWSMAQTPSGIYFMDSINKAIFMFNGQLNNLSASLGMNTWCKDNIPDTDTVWTPANYMSDNGTSGGEPINGFMNFVTYYDKLNQDVLFINKNMALAYSERLGVFTSFYDYGNSPYLCNLNDTGVWARIAAELDVEDPDTVPHDEYSTSLWKHQAGDYCDFFGENKPYWMTLIGNPEPQADKIFTNLEFRACVDGEGILGNDGKFTPTTPFDYLETWNEYQHGYTSLSIKNGHNLFKHGGDSSALIRKFRIWRNDIPRNNCLLDSERIAGTEYPYQTDESLNVSRYIRKPQDRMRNPWIYLKLEKTPQVNMPKSEVHDIKMSYFT